MSNSLVYKSLELLGYEKTVKQEKKKKKHIKYKGTLNLIPPKHRIISKNDKTDLSAVLTQTKRVTVYAAKKQLESQQDPTDENIQRLLLLSANCIDLGTVDKILDRAVKKRCTPRERKDKEPEKTAFTEEDFKKFEKEYVE